MPPQLAAVPIGLIPAIGYIRVSLAREEMISPEIQRTAIQAWAARMGREIVDWVEDPDKTGRNFRRKVMTAIEYIEKRVALEIVVYRYDRWGRNAVGSLANIARVEQAGGQVQSATEPLDPETAIGKYNRHNALGLAEMQSNIIGENWSAAHRNRIARGLPPTGGAHYGYILKGRIPDPFHSNQFRLDPTDPRGERYEPDVEGGTAAIHRDLYLRYIAGEGSRSLAAWLNGWGYHNVYGRVWNYPSLFNLLDSGFGAGLIRIHDPECKGCPSPRKCKQKVYLPGAQEAIISDAEWQSYQDRRQVIKDRPPRARGASYPLTGIVQCGHCYHKGVYTGSRSGGKPIRVIRCGYYHMTGECRGLSVPSTLADASVLENLQRWAVDIDQQAAAAKTAVALPAAAKTDKTRMKAEVARLDAALVRLAKQHALEADLMPDGVYEATRDQLIAERRIAETALAAVEDATERSPAEYAPILAGVIAEWDVLPVTAKNAMLTQLVRHVTLMRPKPGGPASIEVTPVWEPCTRPCCVKR